MISRAVTAVLATALSLTAVESRAVDPSPGCSVPTLEHGRRIERKITAAGVERQYILDAPDNLRPNPENS